jgi:hypothetical protein
MSPAMAKLAAYNELLLDEQHKMEDYDMLNKPRHQKSLAPNRPKSKR